MVKTKRETAIAWWNNIKVYIASDMLDKSKDIMVSRQYLTSKYFGERKHESLTGREIQEIWDKENAAHRSMRMEKRDIEDFAFDSYSYELYCNGWHSGFTMDGTPVTEVKNKSLSVRELAHVIADKAHMPYCWEDIENRLRAGIALPFKLND